MKKLVVKPIGGLCTRLLVIDSVIKLVKLLKPDEAIIIWEKNLNINCSFKELFHFPDRLQFIETKGFSKFSIRSYFELYNSFHPSTFRCPFLNKSLGKETRYESVKYADEMDQMINLNEDYFLNMNVESLYVSFWGRLVPKTQEIFKLHPIDNISKQINNIVNAFNKYTIGVHIRRTDHYHAIKYSTTEGFIKAMENKVENFNASFFLSSDSDKIIKTIQKRFGNRIITQDRISDRNSSSGIKDAVIDLFCLSKTKEIIGSYKSTFSQVAAEIGGIDIQEIYVDNKEKTI